MAVKKKQQLTVEEKMQQALVPQEEQPYKIPDNWCWVYIINGFAECLDKYRKPINANERAKRIGNIPYYGATGQVGWIDDYLTDDNLVLIGEDGAPFLDLLKDKAYIINGKAWVNNHAHILKSFYSIYGNKYLCYYLNIFDYKNYINGTTRLKLTQKNLELMYIPLPPLNEQQRIVNVIESLFAKLDEAKQLIQNTIDKFEQNKMAILHKAFSGELTAKWREENNIDLSSWQKKSIAELCKSLKYGTAKKSSKTGSVAVLRMGNLQHGEIDWSDLVYTDDEEDIKKYSLSAGDVLFNRTNGSADLVGKTSIYRGEYPAIYAGYLIKLDYGKELVGEYLNYIMNSKMARNYCLHVKNSGASQFNINAKKIGAFVIPVPTIEEQQEIVNILDKVFIKYDKIRALQTQIDKIELLKKSILAKAFRGELGTNNPNEESAEVLLREILAEK